MKIPILILTSLFVFIITISPVWSQTRPVYFLVPYNTNHDCSWSSSQLDTNAMALLRHIQLMSKHNLKGNYYFTGLSADYFYTYHREILDTMRRYNLPYSHHGANRPPNPSPIMRVRGLYWNADVDSIWRYEKDSLRCNGTLGSTRTGGLRKMRQVIFNTNPVSTGRFFQASILYVTKLYGATQMVGLKGNTGGPSERAWFLGMLNRPDSTGWTIAPDQFKAWALYNTFNLIRYLDSLILNSDRTKFNFVTILMHDTDFWLGLTQSQKNLVWTYYDSLMNWAKNNSQIQPIVLGDLWNLVIDDRIRNVSKSNLSVAVDTTISIIERNTSPFSLPTYIATRGAETDYLSLVDLYVLLLHSLRAYNSSGQLPDNLSTRDILGPTIRTSLAAPTLSNLSGTSVVQAAAVVAETLTNSIPHSLLVFPGMQELDASEFLYTMAQVYRNIYRSGNPQTVRLKDISPYTSQSLYNTSADSLTKLQFWTYKPVRWRTSPTGIKNEQNQIPVNFVLYQNYPNPFNPITKIRFDIPTPQSPLSERGNKRGFVKLIVYDILGREVATLVNEQLKLGTYEVDWNAAGFTSGVYFYRIQVENYSETKKVILLR